MTANDTTPSAVLIAMIKIALCYIVLHYIANEHNLKVFISWSVQG
jgi:hypothetical protein